MALALIVFIVHEQVSSGLLFKVSAGKFVQLKKKIVLEEVLVFLLYLGGSSFR